MRLFSSPPNPLTLFTAWSALTLALTIGTPASGSPLETCLDNEASTYPTSSPYSYHKRNLGAIFRRDSYLLEESIKLLHERPASFLRCEQSSGETRVCTFVGPVQGFLPACIVDAHGGCMSEEAFQDAKERCGSMVECGGFTAVGQGSAKTFVLSYSFNRTEASNDGAISFLKACSVAANDTELCRKAKQVEHEEREEEESQVPEDSAAVSQARRTWPHPRMKRSKFISGEHSQIYPEEEDLDAIGADIEVPPNAIETTDGYEIDGQPSIFIGIASYRDELCRATIEDALEKASFPSRLVFGIVEQNVEGDIPCVPLECSGEDLLCGHLDKIRVHRVSGRLSRGPTWARHRVHKLYMGESFSLQIDAHMVFVADWDAKLIAQWESVDNEMAVLSSYPTDVLGAMNQVNASALRTTRPMMCEFHVLDSGLVRFDAAIEVALSKKPSLHPFWAAGMSFSRGHFVTTVGYDCCSPDLFMGEEIGMTVRAFTHGYDIYAPSESLIFHYYPPCRLRQVPLFWENHEKQPSLEANSMQRIKYMLGLLDEEETSLLEFDRESVVRYGLGNKRTADLFFEMFIDDSIIPDLCHVTLYGALDRMLSRHLRSDGYGIDYDQIDLYDIEELLQDDGEHGGEIGIEGNGEEEDDDQLYDNDEDDFERQL